MKRFVGFLAIGSAFSTVEEFLTVVVLRHDVPSYVFTLVILFPLYLGFVFVFGRFVLERLVRDREAQDVVHFLTFAAVGLVLEWTLMGLAPWSNPDANPFAMFVFQLGMFAFWGTVATAPRIFLDPRESCRRTRRAVLLFAIPHAALTYSVGLSAPVRLRFPIIIPLIIVGYLVIAAILLATPLRSLAARRGGDHSRPAPAISRK
jgi:hypothetical protein